MLKTHINREAIDVWDVAEGQIQPQTIKVRNYRTFRIYKNVEGERYGCDHTKKLKLQV